MNWEWICDTLNMMAVELASKFDEMQRSTDAAHRNALVRHNIANALRDIREAKAAMIGACGLVEHIRAQEQEALKEPTRAPRLTRKLPEEE